MYSIVIACCPLCQSAPKLKSGRRYQVYCPCGASGPHVHTREEAISRWHSVIYFITRLRKAGFDAPVNNAQAN